ncbi:MAG: retroviral-like aspartic protease family protein [Armatimonadota bacterium]|nr:retroviral-like aspartic protease family protein [bacterium]MDW8319984.1 retroviral-like aspartic protease family protein [Armatimonadota bacterium]
MWTVEIRNGASARLNRLRQIAVVLWLIGAAAVAVSQIASPTPGVVHPVLRLHGSVQVLYPMTNTGTITLTVHDENFHVALRVGGVVSESAYNAVSATGWRKQHGLVLPIDASDAQQFSRLSPLLLQETLLRAKSGELGAVDCGTTTLPDGREARWLKIVPHTGAPSDVYCDAQGNLLAWGYHESDDFRRRPTQFIIMPTAWKEWDGARLPSEIRVYEDDRHVQTVRWEQVERLPQGALLPRLKPPAPLPPPAGLPVTLPIRFSQREMFVEVKLNGHEYVMMVDTGAGITVIDQPVAEALRLPAGESMNVLGAGGQGAASITRLASLQLGSVKLRDLQVAVTNLGLIRLIGGERFGGILGFNVLNRFRVTVDYHRRTLTLDRSGGKLPAGWAKRVPFMGAVPMLDVEVEDIGRVPMLLDTGAAMTILPAEVGQQWQPSRSASLGLTLGVGGAGGIPRAARAASVKLGEETVRGVTLMFSSPAPKGAPVQILSEAGFGLIGNNLLRHFRLTIDYPMRTVVLQRMPKPASLDDASTVGIVLDLTMEGVKVAGVAPLSSAWEAGIERGDEVLAVDGRSTQGVRPSEVQKWLAGEEGTCKRVLLQRGTRRWEVKLQCLPMF